MGMKKKNPISSKSKDEYKKKEMDKLVVSEVYHITEDLIMEIHLHLPPISIIRFKQVCKKWYSLFSNPDFITTHCSSYMQFYKHSNNEELMVARYLSKGVRLKDQNKVHPLLKHGVFTSELLDCYPINSCNGLLLLRRGLDSGSYYVCNPINKHLLKIPSIRITEKFKVWGSTSPHILFDPSTSLSYKLIKCLHGEDEKGNILCEFYVYSSETGSWKCLISFPSKSVYGNMAVLLKGIFYWKVYNGDHLVCFDIKRENVWFLPLPPNPKGYYSRQRKCFYFGECNGRLRLIEKYLDSKASMRQLSFPCSFDIMESEPQKQQHDGNLTWSVKYHVSIETGYDGLSKYHSSTFHIIQLYKQKNKGGEEALLLNFDGHIVPFNLKSYTFGKALTIRNTRHLPPYSDFNNGFPYITTTLLPLY